MTVKRNLDHLVDRGCWIADDRVYAFVSKRGIAEVGYHGMQPVSRNSRMLVREAGILLPSVRTADGSDNPVDFSDLIWDPGGVSSGGATAIEVTIRASGRRISVSMVRNDDRVRSAIFRIPRDIPFSGVHGARIWGPERLEDGMLRLECRDLIMFRSWLDRPGPYAGDFLLPESLRRRVFAGGKRSGQATRADLLPEYRERDFPVYDATTTILFGGREFSVAEEQDGWVFEAVYGKDAHSVLVFDIVFGDADVAVADAAPQIVSGVRHSAVLPPLLSMRRFPRWAEFLEYIPSLFASCIVRDYGVPRACPGRYYWLWAWDMLVTASEAMRWGDGQSACDIAGFVNGHRDDNGVIPARWTRSLQPLDTPSPGGIEFLFAALAYDTYLETGDREALSAAYANLRRLFDAAEAEIRSTGMVTGQGFYPDLLEAFGRTRETAVAMEVGSWYCLARITGAIARCLGDDSAALRMDEGAGVIARGFDSRFWDERAGFFRDTWTASAGGGSGFHPLFSLLFLHSSLGLALVRGRIPAAAAYVDQHLLSQYGMRALAPGEGSSEGEPVLDSWYPHWDLYGLKLLRRAGKVGGIIRWLRCCEGTLERLGYCPEFLALRGFREGRADAWMDHGAASNLNCVTAWSRAIREAVFGIDIDPGGMTHIPLMLPVGVAVLRNVCWRGGIWSIEVDNSGPFLEQILVDTVPLTGVTKIPLAWATPGNHEVRIRYGHVIPERYLEELVNAEVVSSSMTKDAVTARVRGAGSLDGTYFSRLRPVITLDDEPVETVWDERTGKGYFGAHLAGEHTLRLS